MSLPYNLGNMTPRNLRRMAKKVAAKHPELRKLYAEQNLTDEDLDNLEKELTDGVEDIFKHGLTPNDLKTKDNTSDTEEQEDA